MTLTAAPARVATGQERPAASRLKRFWWHHPEVPAAVVAVAAWIYLAVDHWASHDTVLPWRFHVVPWTAMVLAMMVPAAIPAVRLIAFDSMWKRRHRAPTLFVATYVAVWTAAAAAFALVIWLIDVIFGVNVEPNTASVVIVLLAAAGWQFTDAKRRALRRCHQRTALAPRGWKADRAVVRYGLFHSRACIWSCGLAMVAMFLSAHDFHLMIPLTIILSVERLQKRPTPHLGGIAIAVLALLTSITGV